MGQVGGEVKCERDVEELVEYSLAAAKPLAAFLLDEFLNPLICFAKDKATLLELIITNLCFQKCQNVTQRECFLDYLVLLNTMAYYYCFHYSVNIASCDWNE